MSSDEQNRSDGGESRGARRRRWAVRLGALAAVGLALRAILPLAAEIGIERAASGAVRGQLELGDVDLGLLRGAITLEDLRFGRPRDAGGPGSDAPVQVKRVSARIAWLDLIERRVRIRALEIDAPRLTLQRRPESGFDLVELLAPAPAPSNASDAADGSDGVGATDGRKDPGRAAPTDAKRASEETSSWSFVLDRGVLEGGRLRLVDLTVERTKRWKAKLTEIRIKHVGFEPSTHAEPTRLVLEGELEGAPLSLSAEATRRDDVLAYRGDLRIQGLPLREMQLYLEDIGWNRLQANLDADLHFEGDSDGQAEVQGSAALREVMVGVSADAESALRIGAIEMETSGLVVHERRIQVESLVVRDAELLARAGLPPTLPLLTLARVEGPADSEEVPARTARQEAAPTPQADSSSVPRWQLGIKRAEILDSRIRQLDSGVRLVIESARLEELESGPDSEKAGSLVARLALRSSDEQEGDEEGGGDDADRGSLELEGQLTLEPASFDGELTWTAIDGPTLNRALASPIALQSLRSGGRLAVRASAAPGQPVLRLSGDLELEDLSHESEAPESPNGHGRCLAEIRALRLDLEELRLAPPDQDPRPLVIRLAGVELEDPHLEIDRTDEGLGCRELLPARTTGDEPREDDAPSSDGSRIEPHIRIDRFTTRGGIWVLRDRTVSPFVTTRLESVEGTLEELSAPAAAIRHFEVSARGLGSDPLRLNGSYEEDRLELELALERVGLPRYNPYLVERDSFVAVERGDLSLRLDLSAERQHGFEGDLRLVLHDADLTALSPEGFRESFGVSLSLAMALLRNVQGDIVIDAPFASSAEDGIDLGVARLVTAALRRALLNALATPLKLVGAVISRDGGIKDFEMQPIVFEPGRTLLAGPALDQIEQLAGVLAQRPWLAVQLQPKTVQADRNVEAEPVEGPAEGAVEGAIEPPKPEALARTRARLIADRLQTHFGVDPERIRVEAVPQDPGSGPPRVAASIVPVGDPLEPEEPLGRPGGASGGASLGK